MRSGSNILTRGIAEGTGGTMQYNADLLARNIAFGENNRLDFASDEARKQFMLSFAIGAVAEVPHAFGSFKGYKAGYSNLDMYQRAADGLWEYENNNKFTVEQLGKSGIIKDRTPESLVAQEIADSRMKSMGIEDGQGHLKQTKNPLSDPKIAKDIQENSNAVYGYSPKESSSLNELNVDWTDPDVVAEVRIERIAYNKYYNNQRDFVRRQIEDLKKQGKSIEEYARIKVEERNNSRMQTYIKRGDYTQLERMKQRNLREYGRAEGPTPEQLFEKYGSWEEVVLSSLRPNRAMDVLTGLYNN